MGNSTICFIAGGDSVARSVYTQERFGYFSSAFDTILEKHGILDFCRASPDILDQPADLRCYPVLLIAWMPPRFWKLSYLRSLWEYDGVVILEGPFPEFLEEYVGVERISRIREYAGCLEWRGPEMEEGIREHLQALVGNEKSIPVEPKMVATRPMPRPRRRPWNIRLGFQSQTPGMSEATSEHAKRWAAPPYWIEPYTTRGAEVLATLALAEGLETAAVVRQGRVLATTFQTLSYLVHFHTMHPLKEPLLACETRPAIALEKLFINQMVRHAASNDVPILQVAPWPDGKQFAITVRHDVDRIPPPNKVREIFEIQRGHALRGTWCWIADRLDARLIRTVESEGDEVALHAFSLGRKQEEVSVLRSLVSKQEEVLGETVHGGGGSGWLGAPSVVGAAEAGLRYTEFLPLQLLPTQFLILDSDGKVHRLDEPICLSFSGSVDPEIVRKRFTVWGEDPAYQRVVCNGGYLLLLTHPDFPTDRLEKALDSLPIMSGQGMTCAEVAAWWNATHSQKSLQIERVTGADELRFRLKTAQVIRGLTLRVASPLDLDAKETGEMHQPGQVILNLEPNTTLTVVVKR